MIKYASSGVAEIKMDISDIVRRAAFSLGFDTLRPKQEEIISAFPHGNDIFGVCQLGKAKRYVFYASRQHLICCCQKNQDTLWSLLSVLLKLLWKIRWVIQTEVPFCKNYNYVILVVCI